MYVTTQDILLHWLPDCYFSLEHLITYHFTYTFTYKWHWDWYKYKIHDLEVHRTNSDRGHLISDTKYYASSVMLNSAHSLTHSDDTTKGLTITFILWWTNFCIHNDNTDLADVWNQAAPIRLAVFHFTQDHLLTWRRWLWHDLLAQCHQLIQLHISIISDPLCSLSPAVQSLLKEQCEFHKLSLCWLNDKSSNNKVVNVCEFQLQFLLRPTSLMTTGKESCQNYDVPITYITDEHIQVDSTYKK